MTLALLALAALLVGFLAYRIAKLPGVIAKRAGVAQALTGTILPLAQQPANMPWVPSLTAATGPSAPSGQATTPTLGAGDWYDPTTTTIPQTFNEYGFITSPSPAPVNPKTGTVPLTNADVCSWIGHMPPVNGTCPRCGAAVA